MTNNLKFNRPSWDQYFMQIAAVIASRSNCLTRQTGSVIVKDKMIISTGYNGTPRNLPNCNEGGCPRCNDSANHKTGINLDKCFCVHAEENAIIQAAYHGMSTNGATIYAFYSPCIFCAKSIINAGITHIVYKENYSADQDSQKIIKIAGILVEKVEL